jgi:hypothetical protein
MNEATIIQLVFLGEDSYLFLYGFNKQRELMFRSSKNIEHLQSEPIKIDVQKQMAYTIFYQIPTFYFRHFQ